MSEFSKSRGNEFSMPMEHASQHLQEIKFLEDLVATHSTLIEQYTHKLEKEQLSTTDRELTEHNLNQALENVKEMTDKIQEHKVAIAQLYKGDEAMKRLLEDDERTHEA